MISINEAAKQGICRLRKEVWSDPCDHLKLDLIGSEGGLGPWFHLYAPFNLRCNGRDPVDILCMQFDLDCKEWLPYEGPLPDSDEYKARVADFDELEASP